MDVTRRGWEARFVPLRGSADVKYVRQLAPRSGKVLWRPSCGDGSTGVLLADAFLVLVPRHARLES